MTTRMRIFLPLAVLLVTLCPGTAPAESAPAESALEVAPTWERAHVALPKRLTGGLPVFGLWRDRMVQTAVVKIAPAAGSPAVVLLHGCNGIAEEEEIIKLILAQHGFSVFLPNSFARIGRRANCDLSSYATSLFPQAHDFRLQEIDYALDRLRAQPWIDPDRIFLMGFSEGGMAAARYDGDAVAGIVITGWHCQGREPYVGIKAPPSVPVLTMIGGDDPWYQAKRGKHCGQVFDGRTAATSVVLPGNGHAIVNSPIVENAQAATEALLRFLGAE